MKLTKHQKKILRDMVLYGDVILRNTINTPNKDKCWIWRSDTYLKEKIRINTYHKLYSLWLLKPGMSKITSLKEGVTTIYYKPTPKAIDLVKNNFRED
jgi:hypothetical protein